MDNANRLSDPENLYIPGFRGIMKKIICWKKKSVARWRPFWKAENLIRWSPYSWTWRKKLERYNNFFSSHRINNFFFKIFDLDLWPWPCWCSSQKGACGSSGGARRGRQYPLGSNGPRGENNKWAADLQNWLANSPLMGDFYRLLYGSSLMLSF